MVIEKGEERWFCDGDGMVVVRHGPSEGGEERGIVGICAAPGRIECAEDLGEGLQSISTEPLDRQAQAWTLTVVWS